MPDRKSERLIQFKNSIGYYELSIPQETDRGVVLDWPMSTLWGQLKNEPWQIRGDTIMVMPGSVQHSWILNLNEEYITVDVFVSSTGQESAVNFLFEKATNTSLPDVPFEKGPPDLGQFAIQRIEPKPQNYIWTYYNVCFRIKQENHTLDVLTLAKWIQDLAAKHVTDTLSEHKPKIAEIGVSSEKIEVGQKVTVSIQPAPGQDTKRLLLEFIDVTDRLNLVSQEDFSFTFTAVKPGPGIINLALVDIKNLLCTPVNVTIIVLPSDKLDDKI